jgi:hypothetical protein
MKGTRTNGLKTDEYCKFCYAGAFVEPDMTFNDMKETVETQMKKLQLSERLIQMRKHSSHFKPLENDLNSQIIYP